MNREQFKAKVREGVAANLRADRKSGQQECRDLIISVIGEDGLQRLREKYGLDANGRPKVKS